LRRSTVAYTDAAAPRADDGSTGTSPASMPARVRLRIDPQAGSPLRAGSQSAPARPARFAREVAV
jgi:hypothetical protein